ncbi:unnamed protein product [Phytophthora fragariaefolia]|uniref:Unnamed protein product n=1 Tax=Phytophthora fragariaefolia TaxID=1490495 RepID=A0A9W6XMY3_9STRA|nr:unnamed protein product [Phytophthora fragariaefolia]
MSQLPVHQVVLRVPLTPGIPLIDLIDHPESMPDGQSSNKQPGQEQTYAGVPGIHSYVNRILEKVAERAGVSKRLASHSFRRGGAQHANGAGMSVQWICLEHDGHEQGLRVCLQHPIRRPQGCPSIQRLWRSGISEIADTIQVSHTGGPDCRLWRGYSDRPWGR